MELTQVKRDLQQILEVLSSNKDAFEMENGRVNIIKPSMALTESIVAAGIEDEGGFLSFSRFVIPHVFTIGNYERRIEPLMVEQDFVVLDPSGCAVLYFEREFYDFGSGPLLAMIQNSIAYYSLYNFLKSGQFADHHNSADEEIVIYSSAKGILKIKYPSIAPSFHAAITEKVKKLLDVLQDQQFRTYFKNALFDIANCDQIDISGLIINGNIIISTARRDLEIALRQFDFEKFRDALYSQKDKFFVDIRDVLSKIYGQIVGIPISITAAVYATYKTEHEVVVPLLILVSFIVYVAVYMIVQFNYYRDIKEIQADFLRDFNIIRKQSGLPKEDITKEYDKVDRKIISTINIAWSLMAAVLILGLAVIAFITAQL